MLRRTFTFSAAAFALLGRARAAMPGSAPPTFEGRWLELTNTHTLEVVQVAFRNGLELVPAGLVQLDRVLRDHRSGEQVLMDRALYDLLADLADAAGVEPRYEIISGYRSPASNELLIRRGSGVARGSLHLQGKAIDVRLKD
jgi:uncharacterized protein YcbK (DUF882 family)